MSHLMDINHVPDIEQISKAVDNPLFDRFYNFVIDEYKALCKIEYSKDVWAPGWNIKLRKAGKSLCVIYPRERSFTVLVVVGKKEKDRVLSLLPNLCEEMQSLYYSTKEGNGQRWLMIDLKSRDRLYEDTLQLIRIRRESR